MTERTLILLRHAKAADPDDYATDIERPLSARGHRDAAAAGAWLRTVALEPDQVLCSTAVRTRETLQELAVDAVPVIYEQRIYHGPAPDTLDLIQETDPDVATLLVIGHNPTLSILSDLLAPDELPDTGLATSGIAVHRFSGTWRDLEAAPLAAQHTGRG
ncbi:histidine phosphatase family protein [Dactylosporangium sp. AC04546]|uniref:SixA phosphatase family protein n=1 Tax=Dactylosporangium sp. AC04546 TaxID=2862460 RepID=UPI001EDDCF32|nr:histidine phosphatase family protein [Dactylosporangium sp. AC04546]WVK83969.1 histidine phosphatase family protein [Dactylosporangium sp. AC04546]